MKARVRTHDELQESLDVKSENMVNEYLRLRLHAFRSKRIADEFMRAAAIRLKKRGYSLRESAQLLCVSHTVIAKLVNQ